MTDEEQDRFEVRRVDLGTESEGPLGEIAATLVSRGIASRGEVAEFADRRTSSQSVRDTIREALVSPER